MKRFYYDLHIHSCLSPCGDIDMTPNNIAAMSKLKGLDVIALTDHNTARNCPAFFSACEKNNIIPIAGMEITTAEDIHLVCLFESLESALRCSDELYPHILNIKNKPKVFGEQIIMNENDEIIGYEDKLLISATDFWLKEAFEFARYFGALVYPAHIDRQANGIISILGDIPPDISICCVEFHNAGNVENYIKKYNAVENCQVLCSSDAHRLEDINEAENFITLNGNNGTDSNFESFFLKRLKS